MTDQIREPHPKRICQGFQRECTTILSQWNPDAVCSVCSGRRAEWIIHQQTAYAKRSRDRLEFCQRGHVWEPENIIVRGDGGRRCRTCIRMGRKKAA